MSLELIKQLREETGAGVMEAKRALEEAGGKLDKAKEVLAKQGLEKANKRVNKQATSGLIYSYIHGDGGIGVLLELNCETSFVAKTVEFKQLAQEICLQIASMQPESPEALLNQDYIRSPQQKISDLINALVAKTGEKIAVARFVRWGLGEEC